MDYCTGIYINKELLYRDINKQCIVVNKYIYKQGIVVKKYT